MAEAMTHKDRAQRSGAKARQKVGAQRLKLLWFRVRSDTVETIP
jgi:hypothetical protein